MRLSQRVRSIAESPTLAVDQQAKQFLSQGVDVIGFGAGEPDFDPPDFVKEAAARAAREGAHKYTATQGILPLREAIAEKLRKENGLSYRPDEVIVSCGAKHSCFNVIHALCGEGDEVLLPAPYWVSYPEQIRLAGATPIVVESTEGRGFKVTPEDLERRTTARTRLLILNSPSNPTGAVYSRSELEAIGEFVRRRDLAVLSDEIYEPLTYEGGRAPSLAAVSKDLWDRTIVVNGMSKAYAMTGWRIGYAAGPRPVVDAMIRLQSHVTSNPTAVAQHASLAALAGPQDAVERARQEYDRRRRRVLDLLGAIPGMTCVPPTGAFYAFPGIRGVLERKNIPDGLAFAAALLAQARVAVVPGVAFGADPYFRLSYATSMEKIEEGLRRIREFCR